MLMYRDEICHIKGGVGDRVISTKGARLNKGVGATLSWNAVRPCVDNVWGAWAVQDQMTYSHGLLYRMKYRTVTDYCKGWQMCFYNLRENSNNKDALYYRYYTCIMGKFQRFFF